MSILPAVLLSVAAVLLSRGRVTPIAVTMGGLGLILSGVLQLDGAFGTALWVPAASGALAVFIGYVAVGRGRVRDEGVAPPRERRSHLVGVVLVFETIVLALVATHFIVDGVPLFSSNVEVTRLDFGSAFLFGLPGRAYLFGLPFLVILTSAFSARHPGPIASWTVRVAWSAFVCAQILGGFKGALLQVLVVFVLVRASVGRPLRLHEVVGARFVAIGAASVAVALFFAFQYTTLQNQLSSFDEVSTYFDQRLTVLGAQPGYVAMSELAGPHGQPYVIGDLLYTIQKYTKQEFSAHSPYSLDVIVSARLTGQSPGQADFVAPVTVGAFAGWYVDLGWVGAVVAMLFVGGIYGLAALRAAWSASPLRATLWGFATYIISVYVVNGSVIYWAVNGLLMAIALTAMWVFAQVVVEILGLRAPGEDGDKGRASSLRTAAQISARG